MIRWMGFWKTGGQNEGRWVSDKGNEGGSERVKEGRRKEVN